MFWKLQRIPIDLIHSVVVRGRDPRIHHFRKIYARWMDPRVKPAGDRSRCARADSNRRGTAIALAASLYALPLTAASAADLTVTISGVRDASGSISAGIYNNESSFSKAPEALVLFRIKATQGGVGFTVHDLPPGRYAVTAYHDENGNGRLDVDPTGLPTEGYGVSNNARNPTAPPEFAKAAFELRDQHKSVTINIEY